MAVLNELSLWMFINAEAYEQTVPWHVVREGNIWFLQHKEGAIVYAFLVEENWELGERRSFQIQSIKAREDAEISVLGHGGEVLEYQPEVDPSPRLKYKGEGIEISIMRAQRIYNDRKWPNPLVVKIEY